MNVDDWNVAKCETVPEGAVKVDELNLKVPELLR
jgi:hypothetical protein